MYRVSLEQGQPQKCCQFPVVKLYCWNGQGKFSHLLLLVDIVVSLSVQYVDLMGKMSNSDFEINLTKDDNGETKQTNNNADTENSCTSKATITKEDFPTASYKKWKGERAKGNCPDFDPPMDLFLQDCNT